MKPFSRRQLLSIEEAWNLPISAEMSSRQQQQSNQQSRPSSQPYQKNFTPGAGSGGGGGGGATTPTSTTPQGPPPPYPSPKRFKNETGEQKPAVPAQQPTPAFYLNSQQMQMLHCLQQNANNLQPAQQVSSTPIKNKCKTHLK